MPTFALERLPVLCGRVEVYALQNNGKSDYQQFWDDHRSDNFAPMLLKLDTRLREVADLRTLPQAKWRRLTPKTDEFEAKADDLRLYCIKTEVGFIIMTIGLKGNQREDIARMRTMKARFLASLVAERRGR